MAASLQTEPSIPVEFTCKIGLDILKKPVQCQRNEHYFCTVCITKHLTRSQSCPLCMEKLTTETLRPIPRVVADLLSQIETPRCKYVDRGCTEKIKYKNQAIHHQVCGFAPVVCSNEGCGETVNKQDQASHEKESCPLRKTKCEVCDEEMFHRNYEKHCCVLREELDEVKLCLVEINSSLKKIQEELTDLKGDRKPIKNLSEPVESTSSSSSLRRDGKEFLTGQQPKHSSSSNCRPMSGQIVVAGGNDGKTMRSYEVFNWSTKSWTLFKDALFFDHYYPFSFPHDNNIMICGGVKSNRVERLDFNNSRCAYAIPSSLPSSESGKGVLSGDEIITFGCSVSKTALKPPYSSKRIKTYPEEGTRRFYGTECINESIVVVGGKYKHVEYRLFNNKCIKCPIEKLTDHVLLHNPVTNELKHLAPLPYEVSHMTTVPYKDNIIILGGQDSREQPLDNVIMYSITNQECKMLPRMLEKRSGCTAVIMGEMIVVMGGCTLISTNGRKRDKALNTVEYLVLGEDAWKQLPPMHCERVGATALVQV